MIWLDVIKIIMRIFFGLCCVGFTLGLFLHEKYSVFAKIFEFTVIGMVWYGFMEMFAYTVFGF